MPKVYRIVNEHHKFVAYDLENEQIAYMEQDLCKLLERFSKPNKIVECRVLVLEADKATS